MSGSFDADTLFDQQASLLLEQSQRRAPVGSPIRLSTLNPASASLVDHIANRVGSLEERLNACDSMYRLAAQTNAAREKERRRRHQSLVQSANSLERRVMKAEEQVSQVPQLIRETVREEMRRHDNTAMVKSFLEQSHFQINERLTSLETYFVESNKKTQKSLKKLKVEVQLARTQPEDDGRVDDIAMQIAELKRRQGIMLDLLNAMRMQNDQDFDSVNSQLNGLWTQLSAKRSESPFKQTD
jgi:uncharacterized membrane-anchored protein YjiN (DUF445 family)